MNSEIASLLNEYSAGVNLLEQQLAAVSHELRNFKPGPSKWSIHEIVIHLADSEVQGFLRIRTAIAESGTTAVNCDENKWADELDYEEQSYTDALTTIALIRKTNLQLLQNVPLEKWNRYVIHSICGKLSLFDLVKTYNKHIPLHLEQIKRNEAQWKSGNNTSIITNK